MSIKRRIFYAVISFTDWLIPETKELRHAQWQLITAARNCAGKLRVEMHRGSISPRAEYDILIEESAKYGAVSQREYRK